MRFHKTRERLAFAVEAIRQLDATLQYIEGKPGFIQLERKILRAIQEAEAVEQKHRDKLEGTTK